MPVLGTPRLKIQVIDLLESEKEPEPEPEPELEEKAQSRPIRIVQDASEVMAPSKRRAMTR